MGEDLGGRWPLLGLHIQHQPYEVLDKNNDDTDTVFSNNECILGLGDIHKKEFHIYSYATYEVSQYSIVKDSNADLTV